LFPKFGGVDASGILTNRHLRLALHNEQWCFPAKKRGIATASHELRLMVILMI